MNVKTKLIMKFSILVCLLALIATGSTDNDLNDWDYIVFSQQWPSTICTIWKEKNETNRCAFPTGLDSWTIHGSWPSDASGEDPQFCNSSWSFNVTKIQTLMTNLTLHWPNIYGGTSQDEFWAHEWTKHGTCAADDHLIHNEFGYFETALQLAHEYNITIALLFAGVVPGVTRTYSVKDFRSAVETQFGMTPMITCYKTVKTKKYLVQEIRLCLDRDFKAIKCEESGGAQGCPDDDDIYYMPMDVHVKNYTDKKRGEL